MEINICCIKVKKLAYTTIRDLRVSMEAASFLLEEVMASEFH